MNGKAFQICSGADQSACHCKVSCEKEKKMKERKKGKKRKKGGGIRVEKEHGGESLPDGNFRNAILPSLTQNDVFI